MVLAKYNTSNISKFLDEIDKISIGLDPWFTSLNSSYTSSNYYPPYNILDMGEGKRRLEIAVAGCSKTEIEVYTEKNLLTVETNRTTRDEEKYCHNGIARRSFRRSWTLGDDVRVDDVNIVDGLLTVELSTIIPEHQRKKSYTIR
jgi:molecular chaperone IbpA